MRNPKRNLPLSLAIGTGAVSLLYIACNFVYLSVLPMSGIAERMPQDRVATAVMQTAFGPVGAKLMAAAILVSHVRVREWDGAGGGARVLRDEPDGLFFKSTGKLDSKGVPKNSLWIQCAWTCLLCLSGQYGNLLDYVILAALVFYALTIMGLFVLRRTTAGGGAAVQGVRVSGAAGAVYRDGGVDLWRAFAIQTSVHLAGADSRSARCARVRGVETGGESSVRIRD